ncbi:MAG: CPBP family intramembrane metalloprotease [Eubacterium sp.]|nr:CPBP family intramembrane metalloprotease [Eubacterium sp.]
METLLRTPKAVLQARESKKGLNLVLEILIFAAIFLVCTIGETVFMLPAQIVLLAQNQLYLDAVGTGDVELISEAAVQAASADSFTIVSLFATSVMILLVILFCRFIQKRKLSSLGFVKKGCGKEYVTGILIGFGMFSAAVLLCIVTGSIRFTGSGTFAVSTFLLFTAGYMVQGMAEEVLCRGYFMVSVGRRYPMAAAVIANATAFAALHLLNPGIAPLAIVNLILFGIFASVCFIKTENIWMVGAIHSVWNLVQGNVYGIKVSGMQTQYTVLSASVTEGRELINGGAFGLEGGLAVTMVLLAGTAAFYFYKRKDGEAFG